MTNTLSSLGAESSGIIESKVVYLRVDELKETPENWSIYRAPADDETAWIELCKSVDAGGILSPLDVSADLYVISGLRRLRAAIHCGKKVVPCIIDALVEIEDMGAGERIKLLSERNRGTRIKSDSEMYLEAAARVDPEDAIREAQLRKYKVFNEMKTSDLHLVQSVGGIRRTDPTRSRSALMNAVLDCVEEKRADNDLPTGERDIHYAILNKKVLTSSGRNGHVYGTKRGDSALLSKLITDARSAGVLRWEDFIDETRPVHGFHAYGSIAEYEHEELDGLFRNYTSDVHREQENHIEILVEKNTILPKIVKGVGNEYRLTVSSCRGYGNLGYQVTKRFRRSGKSNLIVVYVSDLDPEGVDMPAAFKKYMEHDFGIEATTIRAGVTMEQVERFNLPPDIDVKLTSSRAKGFIRQYGNQCWELDSVPTKILVGEVKAAVSQCLDSDILNKALDREKEADILLARQRAAVIRFLEDYKRQQNGGAR